MLAANFLQTTDMFRRVRVIGYVPYWGFSSTHHIEFTFDAYDQTVTSGGGGDGGCQASDSSLTFICMAPLDNFKQTMGHIPAVFEGTKQVF